MFFGAKNGIFGFKLFLSCLTNYTGSYVSTGGQQKFYEIFICVVKPLVWSSKRAFDSEDIARYSP